MAKHNNSHQMDRRKLLIRTAQLALGLCLTSPSDLLAKSKTSQIVTLQGGKKKLPDPITLVHTHTYETFELSYFGRSVPPTIKKSLYSFLRDYQTGDVHPIDFRLMDILRDIQRKTGSKGVYEVISGYRSPQTNSKLRSKSVGVAKKSLHLTGQAIDIRLTDISTRRLRDTAIALQAGGVGYYRQSDFVHIDTGKVRAW